MKVKPEMTNITVRYPVSAFQNIDERLVEVSDASHAAGLEFVIVKGTAWNRCNILDGSDLDFFMTRNGQYQPYDTVPDNIRALISERFRDLLVVPRGDDYDAQVRALDYYIDCELTLHLDKRYSEVSFINDESKNFFEEGILDINQNFIIRPKFIRFLLNRLLEDTGKSRKITPIVYKKSLEAIPKLGLPPLYSLLLSRFERQGALYVPILEPDTKEQVLKFLEQGGSSEYLIYIKPLNKAYKSIQANCEL